MRQNMVFGEKCGSQTQKSFIFKAFYFFFVSAMVMKIAFSPVYYRQLGLSASYTGILSGTAPFIRGVGAPLLGYLADKTSKRKLVFLVSMTANAITPILVLIPRPGEQVCKLSRVNRGHRQPCHLIHKGENHTQCIHSVESDVTNLNTTEYLLHHNLEIHTSNTSANIQQINTNEYDKEVRTVFLIQMALLLIGEFIAAPARNLADAVLLETLASESSSYGAYRLWGSVGQIVSNVIVTFAAKYIHLLPVCDSEVQDDYGMSMYVVSFSVVIAFAYALQINFTQESYNTEKIPQKILFDKETSLRDSILNFRGVTLIIIILYLGIVDGVFFSFMFWYLIDLNPSQATWIMGASGIARCTASMLMFGLSGKLIRAIGVFNTIHFSLVMYVFAFFFYGVINDPWLALIPELLQCLAFATSMPACILYFTENSPPRLSSTAQGKSTFARRSDSWGGGGVLPCMAYTGKCHLIGYGFWPLCPEQGHELLKGYIVSRESVEIRVWILPRQDMTGILSSSIKQSEIGDVH